MSEEKQPESFSAEWELVEATGAPVRQFRQKVAGGWLVVCAVEDTASAVFLPDPDYSWQPPIKQSRKRQGYF